MLGVDGSWLPLPTRPQQYCDPALLVLVAYYATLYTPHFVHLSVGQFVMFYFFSGL